MTYILGLSGKKQSGKNTCANFLLGNVMKSLGIIDWMKITDKGQLAVPAYDKEAGLRAGIMDPERQDVKEYLDTSVSFAIKLYSNADALKDFLINVIGFKYEQCYGTNEQKESLCDVRWESLPWVMTNKLLFEAVGQHIKDCVNGDADDENPASAYVDENFMLTYHEPGQMTAREVMQQFGTNICRRMYGNCWVDALIRRIRNDQPSLAVVTDCRFPNEITGIQVAGGKVVRFLRAPFAGQDEHESETALDDFPLEDFDAVVDNRDGGPHGSIQKQNREVARVLEGWGFVKVGENIEVAK
jgi:hypothetical protein